MLDKMSVQQTFCYLLNLKSMFTVSIESFRGYMGQTMYPMDYIGYNKVITHWYVCLTTGCFHVLYTDIQRSRLRHALSRRVQNAHVSGKGLGTGASLPSPLLDIFNVPSVGKKATSEKSCHFLLLLIFFVRKRRQIL